jgi:hypothetical protein
MTAEETTPRKGHESIDEKLTEDDRRAIWKMAREHEVSGEVPIFELAVQAEEEEPGEAFLQLAKEYEELLKVEQVASPNEEVREAVQRRLELEGRTDDDRRRKAYLLEHVEVDLSLG